MSLRIVLPLIALCALLVAAIPEVARFGLSALPLAIVMGMLVGHCRRAVASPREVAFTRFCQQRLLRLGIILFGFGLSFQQLAAVGWRSLLLDGVVICTVFVVGTLLGTRVFRLHRDVAILTSVGSAVCGAAAVMATESVLKSRQQHVTVAIATVVLFGTLAMFSYPLIYQFSGMSEQAFGIYIGSTVHEVAQAVAAGEAVGGEALQAAVVVKLIRVMMLAPFILLLSTFLARRGGGDGEGATSLVIPWFVLGFIAAAGINSLQVLPPAAMPVIQLVSQFTLAIAMAALGVQTRWSTIRQAGAGPMVLALILFLLLIVGGFFLNQWLIGAR